jgi:DnaJ-class molecular chaperone
MAAKKTKSHYETLGVAENATPEQVKRAYRSKAKKHHPDKGGDEQEFASVAAAYEVLGDPQRRLLYDATGQDRERSIKDEADQLLLTLFNQTILSGPPLGKTLERIEKHLSELTSSFTAEQRRLEERQKTVRKLREKITSTSETNLAHVVIDNELKGIDHALSEIDHRTAVVSACKETLKTYSEEKEPEPTTLPSIYFHSVRFDFTTGGQTT